MFLNLKPKSTCVLALVGLTLGIEASLFSLKASSQVFFSDGTFQLNPFVSSVLPISFLDYTFDSRDRGGEYHRALILAESYKHLENYKNFEYDNGENITDYEFIIGHRFDYE